MFLTYAVPESVRNLRDGLKMDHFRKIVFAPVLPASAGNTCREFKLRPAMIARRADAAGGPALSGLPINQNNK